MSFHKCYCFIAVCDGCGEDCWTLDMPPHFASAQEARQTLAAAYEWRVTRQIDGRFEMLCGRCADKQDCGKNGCDWTTPELDHGSEQQDRWDAAHPGEVLEMCRRCGTVRLDKAPAAGHPDSTTRELSDDDEELLAEIERIEFPDGYATSVDALNADPITDYIYRDEA